MSSTTHSLRRSLRPFARHATLAGIAVACALGSSDEARAEALTSAAYRIDIANNLVWYDNEGQPIIQATASRLSVLQRWNLQSQPTVRITNTSTTLKLAGVQLDLSNAASKIIDCTWLEAPDNATWNWNDATTSAYFQFRDPIAPGSVVSMRLGTAARSTDASSLVLSSSGLNLNYTMNQTFFHPCAAGCVDTNLGFGVFSLFSQPASDPSPPVFNDMGLPVGNTIVQQTVNLGEYPLTPEQATNPAGGASTVVPVPEPGTIALAASALIGLAATRLIRRRAA